MRETTNHGGDEMTTAAADFIKAITIYWDSFEQLEATAERGLAEIDAESLRGCCETRGEDYDTAESDVLTYIRHKVNS